MASSVGLMLSSSNVLQCTPCLILHSDHKILEPKPNRNRNKIWKNRPSMKSAFESLSPSKLPLVTGTAYKTNLNFRLPRARSVVTSYNLEHSFIIRRNDNFGANSSSCQSFLRGGSDSFHKRVKHVAAFNNIKKTAADVADYGPSVFAHVKHSQNALNQHDHDHDHHDHENHDHSHTHSDHQDHDHDHDHNHIHTHNDHHSHDSCCSGSSHSHSHDHGHGHGHGHSHASDGDLSRLNSLQRGVLLAARAIRLDRLAGILRDSIPMSLASLGLCGTAFAFPFLVKHAISAKIQAWLVGMAFFLTGVPALLDATVDILGGNINIHVLMAMAAFGSVFMGTALEGALLLAMFSISHVAEEYFTEKAMGDVESLRESHPGTALKLEDFDKDSPQSISAMSHEEIPVADIREGMLFLVRQGEAVPVDGEVWHGKVMVTTEHLTGETKPLHLQPGDTVAGGARSLDGLLIVKATKRWEDSTVARIMQLTRDAQLNRPKLQRWLNQFGERYSQAVVVLSLAVALLGPLLFKWPFMTSGGVTGSVYRAIGLMVAASPCALAVAPLAYATAVSACARKGILLKGGQALDALSVCNTVAFDKTGTLTTGDLVCTTIEPLHGHDSSSSAIANQRWDLNSNGLNSNGAIVEGTCCIPSCVEEALAIAAAMEQAATHPIARAVLDATEGRKLPAVSVENWEAVPGEGLAATVTTFLEGKERQGPHKARIGSIEFVSKVSGNKEEARRVKEAASFSLRDKDVVLAALSMDDKFTLFHFEDQVREGVASVVANLRDHGGLRLLMLTGDHSLSANRVGDNVGIQEVHAGLKPADKLAHVRRLADDAAKKGSGGLVMVGDGINDAPALAAATVGIVLAERASATAVAAADVLLLQSNLEAIPFVIAKARQTTSLVKQSVALALGCAMLAGVASVLGFLPLWITVLLHEGGTLLVCLNSTRAFKQPVLRNRFDFIGKLSVGSKRPMDWKRPPVEVEIGKAVVPQL